jgi:hypothetical protein
MEFRVNRGRQELRWPGTTVPSANCRTTLVRPILTALVSVLVSGDESADEVDHAACGCLERSLAVRKLRTCQPEV